MKLLIVCRSFHQMAGGVERMATALMNEMCSRGHTVSFMTWDQDKAELFYELDNRISWYRLALGDHRQKATWGMRWQRARKVRQIIRHVSPDIVLCFQHGTFLSTRLFSLGLGKPVICAERNAPSRFRFIRAGKWQNLIFQTYRLAPVITVQCESYRQDYPAYLRKKIVTIPNPVFPAPCQADPAGQEDKPKILLSVGRLGYQKNYPVLIKAFARLADKFPGWRLKIIGEGEDRNDLETMSARHGLKERVSLPGTMQDISPVYCSSHLLCLPSRWEGFPNVLAEAMAHGLPCAGFEDCAGVRDLIRHGKTGLLAKGMDNPESLADTLGILMKDADKRTVMGKAGRSYTVQFQPEKIYDQWENLFTRVIKQ